MFIHDVLSSADKTLDKKAHELVARSRHQSSIQRPTPQAHVEIYTTEKCKQLHSFVSRVQDVCTHLVLLI